MKSKRQLIKLADVPSGIINDRSTATAWNIAPSRDSPRTIKETFVPPVDYRYPFLQKD